MEAFHITPDPSAEEREAILAALGADAAEQSAISPWAQGVLPARGREEDEP